MTKLPSTLEYLLSGFAGAVARIEPAHFFAKRADMALQRLNILVNHLMCAV